ncbi:MAG: fatty acid hydroxylase [Armatimonadetes bacterium]|nr:fatty acid hydroxylase [Armatimonadota bacterium]
MSTTTLFWELGAFVVYFLYGSYFEWFFHRYLFHSPKYIYRTFQAHTLVHHQIYKGDDTYYAPEDDHEHPEHVTMDWWALLAMIAFHLPFLWLVQRLTGIPSLWGGVAAITVYYGLYESLHWVMHVPRAVRALRRFRWFRFLDAHHKVHHKYMLSNLNVILPLADLTLGTLRDADGRKVRLFGRAKTAASAAE